MSSGAGQGSKGRKKKARTIRRTNRQNLSTKPQDFQVTLNNGSVRIQLQDVNYSNLLFVPQFLFRTSRLYLIDLKLSAQPYGQPNAKYVHFCTCTRYLMCT